MHNVTFPCLLLATHSKSLDHEIGGKKTKKKKQPLGKDTGNGHSAEKNPT